MKYFILYLVLFLYIKSFSQGFPVKTIGNEDLEERVAREGMEYTTGNGLTTIWSGETSLGIGALTRENIKAAYINNITISCSRRVSGSLVYGRLVINGTTPVGASPVYSSRLILNSGTNNINFKNLIKIDRSMPDFRIESVEDCDPTLIKAIAIMPDGVTILGSSKSITPGSSGKFSYTTTVTNNSGSATSGTITVRDKLPVAVKYISSSGTGWSINIVGDSIIATTSDVINNGATKSFSVTIQNTVLINAQISGTGRIVDNDINYNAPPGFWNGTSITAGAGITRYTDSYCYLIRNWLRDSASRKIDTRVINRAIPGSQSSNQEYLRQFDNRYDCNETPRLSFFEHGVNDVVQSIPTATTIDNARNYYLHFRRQGSGIDIFFFAPPPHGTPSTEALLVTLNTALKAAVLSWRASDIHVHYIEGTRNMWNPVTQSGIYTTDGVHLNAAGCYLFYQQWRDYVIANNVFN